jgi:hypothetical protein
MHEVKDPRTGSSQGHKVVAEHAGVTHRHDSRRKK